MSGLLNVEKAGPWSDSEGNLVRIAELGVGNPHIEVPPAPGGPPSGGGFWPLNVDLFTTPSKVGSSGQGFF